MGTIERRVASDHPGRTLMAERRVPYQVRERDESLYEAYKKNLKVDDRGDIFGFD